MIVRDVNNYISLYSGTNKTKLKGCFEIYKELHKKLEESNKNNVPYIMYKINYDLDNFVAEFYKIEHKSNGIYAVTNLNDNNIG